MSSNGEVVVRDHWVAGVRRRPTANCNARPVGTCVSLIVVHGISLPPGRFGAGLIPAFFCNELDTDAHPGLESLSGVHVSSHLFVTRRGAVTQFVGFDQRAWHAGVSSYAGRSDCNDFSIGIELEGTDDKPYTTSQYLRLTAVVEALLRAYPDTSLSRIVGHNEIAPGRKTDPGAYFDWPRLYEGVIGASP